MNSSPMPVPARSMPVAHLMAAIFALVAGAICVSSTALGTAAAEPAYPEVMFILDGSGSMWGQVEGEAKIAIARRVLGEVVPGLPAEVKVGLAAYGHREKGNCDDVEILMPAGSDDREALLTAAQAIRPKGKTPIRRSVEAVCELLKTKEEETTIILVSDGKETCDDDPCGAVAALKEAGIRFVLHVVGFGVSGAEQAELECLAEAGGGSFFSAGDGGALLAALDTVKEKVAQKVEAAKTTTVQAVSKIGKLRLAMPSAGTVSIDQVKIVRTSDGKVVKTAEDPGADSVHPLMAGHYELVMGFANPNYKDPTEVSYGTFAITGGETTTLELGLVSFNVAPSLEDMPVEAVTLMATDQPSPEITLEHHGNGYYLFKPKPVPAGNYGFSIRYKRSPAPTPLAGDVVVAAGEEAVVTLDAGLSLVKPEAGGVEGWNLIPAGTSEPVLVVRRRWDNQEPLWRVFAVPPGTYDLDLVLDGMDDPLRVGEGLTVASGDLVQFATGL